MYWSISQIMKGCGVVTMMVVLFPHVAEGQILTREPSATSESAGVAVDGDEYALLTYEVGDLVLHVADFPYSGGSTVAVGRGRVTRSSGGGGFGGGGGRRAPGAGGQDVSSSSDRITMDDLISVLEKVVAPESWSTVGGAGEAEQLGTSLVVWQTRAQHQQIETLLKQLREAAGDRKTVRIDARWLLLDSADLDRLMPPGQNGLGTIDRDSLAAFTRRPTSIRAITNCFSGQLVYLVSGTRRNVISSFIPVVGSTNSPDPGKQLASLSGGARITFVSQRQDVRGGMGTGNRSNVGYQPVVETPNFGALLEIRPTLIRGENIAVVELRSTLTVPVEHSGKSGAQAVLSPGPPFVDRVPIDKQEFATTLRMPLRQPVLVGGLTYISPSFELIRNDAQLDATQKNGATAENRQLYLVLEVR